MRATTGRIVDTIRGSLRAVDETTERTVDTPPRFSPAAPLPPAPRLGRYVIVRHLGSGGMGSVYVAYDEELDRRVAIKLLHDTDDDAHARARMLREAQALARLSHPNVVQIHDIGELGGRIFMAMEFVEGTTLRAWRDEHRPGLDMIREKYLEAGRGLAAAHAAGLAHRDFKADNVVLGEDGRVRVLDFGLARVDRPGSVLPVQADIPAPAAELTRVGALVGTPAYMSPEQFRGRTADARSDQFSFCAALFEAFYGVRPFAGDTIEALDLAVTHGTVRPPPPGVEVSPRIHRALLRGLARDPADRWPSLDDLLAVLAVDPHADPSSAPGLRRRLLVVAVVFDLLIQIGLLTYGLTIGGAPTAADHRAAGILIFAMFSMLWLAVRPLLRAHAHHFAVLNTFTIGIAGTTLARVILHLGGAELRTMISADLMIMAAVLAVGGTSVARWILVIAVIAVALATTVALLPASAVRLAPVAYPILDLSMLTAWTLASRVRAPRPA